MRYHGMFLTTAFALFACFASWRSSSSKKRLVATDCIEAGATTVQAITQHQGATTLKTNCNVAGAGRSVATRSRDDAPTVEEPQEPELPPEWRPGGKYHDGRCCRKMVKYNYIYRWFYWDEDGTIKPNNNAYVVGGGCPSKWWTVDGYYCSQNGAEVYNQFDFKEDSDYVLCCYEQPGSKAPYTYYSGKSCKESEASINCHSYTCEEYESVDEANVTCEEGHDKIVNPDGKLWAHLGGRLCGLSTVGMSDKDCSGYSPKCTQAYCIGSSLSGDSDCRSHCPGFAEASEKYPERLKEEETGKIADIKKKIQKREERRAQAQSGMSPILMVVGGIVGVIALGIAFMCFRQQNAPKVPANWADVDNAQANPKGKGKGKDKGKPEWMAGPPAMAQFDSFSPTSPCYTPGSLGSAPPSWGYVPTIISR